MRIGSAGVVGAAVSLGRMDVASVRIARMSSRGLCAGVRSGLLGIGGGMRVWGILVDTRARISTMRGSVDARWRTGGLLATSWRCARGISGSTGAVIATKRGRTGHASMPSGAVIATLLCFILERTCRSCRVGIGASRAHRGVLGRLTTGADDGVRQRPLRARSRRRGRCDTRCSGRRGAAVGGRAVAALARRFASSFDSDAISRRVRG